MADEELESQDGLESSQNTQLTEADFRGGGVDPPAETAATPAQAEPSPPTIRDLVTNLGYQFGDTSPQDDYTALVQLAREAQEARQLREQLRQQDVYRDLGRQLAPKADQLQQFFQQAEKPAGPKPYEPPPFDKRWASLVDKDEATGLYVAKQGVPREIADKVNAYAQWTADFMENPSKVIKAVVEDQNSTFDQRVSQAVQSALAQYQQQQQLMEISRLNAGWFYQKAQDGSVAVSLNGQPQISPLGNQYLGLVRWAAEKGISNPIDRDQLARAVLAQQINAGQPQQADPNAVASQRQARAVPNGRGNRNPLQALSGVARDSNPAATNPDGQGRSLMDQLAAAMEEEGITDRVFKQEGAFYGG